MIDNEGKLALKMLLCINTCAVVSVAFEAQIAGTEGPVAALLAKCIWSARWRTRRQNSWLKKRTK